MDFRPSALQRELAEATRAVLDKECPPAVLRAAWDEPDPGPWRALAGLGLLVPAGLGLTVTDLLPALAETGRAAVPGPVVETALVAAPLLADHEEPPALVTAAPVGEPVPWAGTADYAVLLDTAAGTARLYRRAELAAEELPTVDRSRPVARVAPSGGTTLTDDGPTVAAAALRGALGTAAQLLGLAGRQLDLTVAYVTARHQFGVPVGSFQAVKHRLADALLAVRFAEPAVWRAGLALDAGAATATRDVAMAVSMAVSMAKALASDAAELVSRTAIQCHGAMGYTDEYDLHLFAKRTWALAASWGTAAEHRARYGAALGLPR